MAGPTILIEGLVRPPREGGIEQVADYKSEPRLAAAQEAVFISDGCTFPQPAVGLCYELDPPVDGKTAEGISTVDAIGDPFMLYAGVQCYLGPGTDYDERARRILREGEGRVLEQDVAVWGAAGVALVAGANPIEAIGRVEQALDQQYLGQGVILMSRFDAILASDALVRAANGRLTTILGTPVIASGWAPIGTIVGTGAITVVKSEVQTYTAQELEKNQEWSIGEAAYTILVDCGFRVHSATSTP